MKRTWRVLLAGFVTGVAVLASAGVAEAGSLDETGGDAKDSGHHKKHKNHKSQHDDSDDSDDSDCSGCGGVHEDEPVDYCEECAEPCADPALNSIPGLGAIPVVSPSESDCRD